MKIHKLKLGPIKTNTYVLEKENKCILIDCPSNTQEDIEKINQIIKNKELLAIIYTHAHFDHISGGYLFNVTQYMHSNDFDLLKKQKDWSNPFNLGNFELPDVKPVEELTNIDDFKFKIIHTPGHSSGSICILFDTENVIFTGDTLFKGTYGRCDLEGSDINKMQKSLKKLLNLKKNYTIHPGHGHSSTLFEEKETFKKLLEEN